ncbi:hypothetical protein D3C72_2051090 [compost metagenome]
MIQIAGAVAQDLPDVAVQVQVAGVAALTEGLSHSFLMARAGSYAEEPEPVEVAAYAFLLYGRCGYYCYCLSLYSAPAAAVVAAACVPLWNDQYGYYCYPSSCSEPVKEQALHYG